MVVTIGIGEVVTLEGAHNPGRFTFHIDEGPTVHVAFPILVENDNHTELNSIGSLGDGAVVIAFLHGDGLDGSGLTDGQRSIVDGAFLGRVAAVERVVDSSIFCGANDAHRLLFIIGASLRGEGRRGYHRRWRLDAFGLHEEVKVEVITGTVQVLCAIWTEVVVVVQGEASIRIVDVVDDKASITRHHGTIASGAQFNAPLGIVATRCEIGTAVMTDDIAVGIGEGVTIAGHAYNPIVAVFFVRDGSGQHLIVVRNLGSEQHARGLARSGVAHGVVVTGVFVEACGNDHITAFQETAQVADTDITVFSGRCGWSRRCRIFTDNSTRNVDK